VIVSDFVARFLYERGVEYVYEVIGGMITRLIDSIHRQGKIRLISVHHEQAAAFAADAMGRLTGIPGVAMATSGPGATNLLTGIGSCYFDSVPAIFITGQVNRHEQKGERPTRQMGFQETDIAQIATPITKAAWQINEPEQLPYFLEKAFKLATSGRPGPVLIDIPMDVQKADIGAYLSRVGSKTANSVSEHYELKEILYSLQTARRPLILVGGGVRAAKAVNLFREFVNLIQIPVVHSLMAVDALPYRHPQRVGLIGTYGNRWANLAVGLSDLLLVLGSRLDIRQTGSDVSAFKATRTIYHVDIDKGEINNRVQGCQPVVGNLLSFLRRLLGAVGPTNWRERSEWMSEIDRLRRKWPDTDEIQTITGINPNRLMHELSRVSQQASVFVVDTGNHQMWAAQSLELRDDQRFVTSGGMGAMGFALPASIGASLATSRPVVMLAGDGGMQMNIQEIQTVAHHRLPIKMVVLNNRSLGMVRQFQQAYFQERYQSTFWGYSAPNFSHVAQAYGIDSLTVSEREDLSVALAKMWAKSSDPFLLEVLIDVSANAYPKIAFGQPMTEMEPFALPLGTQS